MNPDWVSDADLSAFIEGRLEPDRALELREALQAWPALRVRLRRLRIVEHPPQPRALPWFIPPPRVSFGVQSSTRIAAILGPDRLRPGERFELSLRGIQDPGRLQVVVLLYGASGWEVVAPETPDELLPLSELRRDGDAWLVELSAANTTGHQRWAVLLPPLELPVRWDAQEPLRWAALREAQARGEIASACEDIFVVENYP